MHLTKLNLLEALWHEVLYDSFPELHAALRLAEKMAVEPYDLLDAAEKHREYFEELRTRLARLLKEEIERVKASGEE